MTTERVITTPKSAAIEPASMDDTELLLISEKEKTLFSLQAQVYALDKSQKWTPLSQGVITISFLFNESTGMTRIFGMEGNSISVNSTIYSNMQYRRPSETFVQWFDSQHILYGLNLTSSSDADDFEQEFQAGTGKSKRPSGSKLAKKEVSAAGLAEESKSVSSSSKKKSPAPSDRNRTSSSASAVSSAAREANERMRTLSMSESTESQPAPAPTTVTQTPAAERQANELKIARARVKELEMSLVEAEADKSALNETIASQSKTISGLQSQVKQLESDIDRLKTAFHQNSSNVNSWKQQLQTYQDLNEQLTSKMEELQSLYDKFGDVLKAV